ncbi:hypothetical protein [Synechococcus sp. CS-1328]|nr:hypothetical protein [Synechococcus sp. CS-1328]MCT0225049.1 hypothetical protein [Synechococcus sp. CS-1328]
MPSLFTGASVELQDALLSNPYSHRSMDEVIAAALVMPVEEPLGVLRAL